MLTEKELNELISDTDCYVRKVVAEQRYGLDKLINDKNECVREIARKMINEGKSK